MINNIISYGCVLINSNNNHEGVIIDIKKTKKIGEASDHEEALKIAHFAAKYASRVILVKENVLFLAKEMTLEHNNSMLHYNSDECELRYPANVLVNASTQDYVFKALNMIYTDKKIETKTETSWFIKPKGGFGGCEITETRIYISE